jgi:hypothetical protein
VNGASLPGLEVVKANHTERQSSMWVRGQVRQLPDGWRESPLPLEELVITYLSVPGAGALPPPELEEASA